MAEETRLRFSRAEAAYPSAGAAERTDRPPAADPLAELARLIGHDDVFETARRDVPRAVPSSPSEQLQAASRRLGVRGPVGADDLRAQLDPASASRRGSQTPVQEQAYPEPEPGAMYAVESAPLAYDPHYSESEPTAYAPSHEYASAHGEQHPEGYYADGGADPAADYDYGDADVGPLPPERRRGGFALIAAVVGLAVVGTAGAYGYKAFVSGKSGAPPVIKADTSPAKVVPSQPKNDGQASRTIYDRADKGQVERVVTREEQPIEMRDARSSLSRMVASPVGSASNVGAPGQTLAPLATTGMAPTAGAEPKKVKTVAIRPDGTVATDASARPQAGVPHGAAGTAPTNAAPPRLPVARPTSAQQPAANAPSGGQGPMSIRPRSETVRPPADVPERTASIGDVGGNPGGSVAAGSHVVQLASQKSEAEAQASFRALQAKYPSVLANQRPLIRRVELGSRGIYYRAQVGPFASIEQANELCSSLKAAGGQCIVQRN